MKTAYIFFLACTFLIAPASNSDDSASKGVIYGTVTYSGRVPNLRPLNMASDPKCVAKNPEAVANPMLTLGEGQTLGNVLIALNGVPDDNYPVPEEAVTLAFDDCMFSSRVTVVRKNQVLRFLNEDGILHAPHGRPAAAREFSIGMPPSYKEKEMTFDSPQPPFRVKCDQHPWMTAYIAVMDNPYYAVTGPDGKFSLPPLPDGTYEFLAWHERLGTKEGKVTIDGGDAEVNFSFSVPR